MKTYPREVWVLCVTTEYGRYMSQRYFPDKDAHVRSGLPQFLGKRGVDVVFGVVCEHFLYADVYITEPEAELSAALRRFRRLNV